MRCLESKSIAARWSLTTASRAPQQDDMKFEHTASRPLVKLITQDRSIDCRTMDGRIKKGEAGHHETAVAFSRAPVKLVGRSLGVSSTFYANLTKSHTSEIS
ncbi:hypothetical protein NDU88_008137 [Pleurodeles waltl]|uniref:Uncharacterized protein n=1 Tax=Pleurodeles waltl TaxID=8319 RepID=A0AAV7RUB6_PLEWA|nr:hypothetical protein NDU88_008137 [Pleurodeles waltl]